MKDNGYIHSNGVAYYYRIYGSSSAGDVPIIVLPGGLAQIESLDRLIAHLSINRRVIAIDIQGHGRSHIGERSFDLIDMGNDIAMVARELGYSKIDIFGNSLGGSIAFRIAVQHPELVRRLVLLGTGYARDGFYPEVLKAQLILNARMAKIMEKSPAYQEYVAVAPQPENFPVLLERLGILMRSPYDWSHDIAGISASVLLVYADGDMFHLGHIIEFYKLLGGDIGDPALQTGVVRKNYLAILPNSDHYRSAASPLLAEIVGDFLNNSD